MKRATPLTKKRQQVYQPLLAIVEFWQRGRKKGESASQTSKHIWYTVTGVPPCNKHCLADDPTALVERSSLVVCLHIEKEAPPCRRPGDMVGRGVWDRARCSSSP